MRIAITGGSGFIGSHVVDRLLRDGHQVIVVDTRRPHRPDVQFTHADINNLDDITRATQHCEVIFHLAAVSDVNDVYANPTDAIRVNVLGTSNVWEAARRHNVARAVLASTVWVYAGATGDDPLDEQAPIHLPAAGHIYTSSKLAAELIAHSYHDLYDVPFTILRYGIPFGPRMREALVIPKFLQLALDYRTITVNGDGSQYRNYIYVEDLAAGHARCLHEAATNEVINLEGPAPISIRDIIESIQRILDRDVAVTYLPGRPGDYRGRTVSAAKAARLLDWHPTTSFYGGLQRYIDWYLDEHPDSRRPTPSAR
jgi:UDP-glucose 4-epimerase